MDRMKLKCNLATSLSDMGLTGKLPCGRLDLLVDTVDTAPPEFQALSARGVGYPKGSREWRVAHLWATTMKVAPPRKPRTKLYDWEREERKARSTYQAGVLNGEVFFKKRFIRELIGCGKDYGRDAKAGGYGCGDPNGEGGNGESEAIDMADGMLDGFGVQPNLSPEDRMSLKECMADYIYQGISSVL